MTEPGSLENSEQTTLNPLNLKSIQIARTFGVDDYSRKQLFDGKTGAKLEIGSPEWESQRVKQIQFEAARKATDDLLAMGIIGDAYITIPHFKNIPDGEKIDIFSKLVNQELTQAELQLGFLPKFSPTTGELLNEGSVGQLKNDREMVALAIITPSRGRSILPEESIDSDDEPAELEKSRRLAAIFALNPQNEEGIERTFDSLLSLAEEKFKKLFTSGRREWSPKCLATFDAVTGKEIKGLDRYEMMAKMLMININTLRLTDPMWFRSFIFEIERIFPKEAGFFDNTEIRNNSIPEGGDSNELYVYKSRLTDKEEIPFLQTNEVFYQNYLAAFEVKPGLDAQTVNRILGGDLAGELSNLKRTILSRVKSGDILFSSLLVAYDPGYLKGGARVIQSTVMSHGVVPPQESSLVLEESYLKKAQTKVKAIAQGPEGIRVGHSLAGDEGAFFIAGILQSGSIKDGTKVIFFTDDALKSGVSISRAPTGGDGLIARDAQSRRAIEVPNRMIFNPQEATIEGVSLTADQTLEYICQLRHELQNNPDLVTRISQAASTYEKQTFSETFQEQKRAIYQQMRSKGYLVSESLSMVDAFVIAKLSGSTTRQEKAENWLSSKTTAVNE